MVDEWGDNACRYQAGGWCHLLLIGVLPNYPDSSHERHNEKRMKYLIQKKKKRHLC